MLQVWLGGHSSTPSLRWRNGGYTWLDARKDIELRHGDEMGDACRHPVHREQVSVLRPRMGAMPDGLRVEGERHGSGDGEEMTMKTRQTNSEPLPARAGSVSDTPLTDEMQKMVIAYDEGDTYDPRKMVPVVFCRDIERAWNAACAFIDSHAADPDITAEMCRTYADFIAKRKALTPSQNVKDHSPIGAVSASNPESNSAAPIG